MGSRKHFSPQNIFLRAAATKKWNFFAVVLHPKLNLKNIFLSAAVVSFTSWYRIYVPLVVMVLQSATQLRNVSRGKNR